MFLPNEKYLSIFAFFCSEKIVFPHKLQLNSTQRPTANFINPKLSNNLNYLNKSQCDSKLSYKDYYYLFNKH